MSDDLKDLATQKNHEQGDIDKLFDYICKSTIRNTHLVAKMFKQSMNYLVEFAKSEKRPTVEEMIDRALQQDQEQDGKDKL